MKIPYVLAFLAWLFLFNFNVHGFIALTRRQHKMMSKEWQSTSSIPTVRSRLFDFNSYIEKLKGIVETKSTDPSFFMEEVKITSDFYIIFLYVLELNA